MSDEKSPLFGAGNTPSWMRNILGMGAILGFGPAAYLLMKRQTDATYQEMKEARREADESQALAAFGLMRDMQPLIDAALAVMRIELVGVVGAADLRPKGEKGNEEIKHLSREALNCLIDLDAKVRLISKKASETWGTVSEDGKVVRAPGRPAERGDGAPGEGGQGASSEGSPNEEPTIASPSIQARAEEIVQFLKEWYEHKGIASPKIVWQIADKAMGGHDIVIPAFPPMVALQSSTPVEVATRIQDRLISDEGFRAEGAPYVDDAKSYGGFCGIVLNDHAEPCCGNCRLRVRRESNYCCGCPTSLDEGEVRHYGDAPCECYEARGAGEGLV